MRLLWLTDVHLNHMALEAADAFLREVRSQDADAILLTGDIAEHPETCAFLVRMVEVIAKPLYFVLGNHDFYFSSVAATRSICAEACKHQPYLHYLTQLDPVFVAPGVALLGHDGWADGRAGDYQKSLIMMNDYRYIEELAGLDKGARLRVLHRLGDEAAASAAKSLASAAPNASQVFFLTHVPPFREACWYQGRVSDDHWAPHFVCFALGQALLAAANRFSATQFTVLCGHTHSPGQVQMAANLLVVTGGAEYGKPQIQQVFEI